MRIVYASLLLALSACKIIGFPLDPNDSASGTSTSGPDATSTSTSDTDTSAITTSGTDTTAATTSGTDTTAATTGTTGAPPTTGVTTGGATCEGLDEAGCAFATDCRAIYGAPFKFPGCTPMPAFLACIEDMDCGGAETVVCRNDSDEVYLLQDTCVPPDYTVCDTMLPACADACLGLDEADCAANPACSPHFGAPHVVQNGMTCADFNNQEFLTCDALHEPCPPVVVTVCPIGQPDTAFDVASGCTPPGFENCMDGPIAECP